MLARRNHRTHAAPRVGALASLLALGGCSSMPEAGYPPFVDHHVAADFVVPAAGRLHLPMTTRDLVVHELELEPAPLRERFAPGERWFEYPPGASVRLRCRLRAYAPPGGQVPSLPSILPAATAIRPLEAP